MKCDLKFLIAVFGSMVLLLSCDKKSNDKGNDGFQNPFAKPCECDKTLQNDSITTFYATNLSISNQEIQLNCAEVEVAIAAMLSKDGNAFCENMYNLTCVSNKNQDFHLNSDFHYVNEVPTDSLLENGNDKEALNIQLQKKKQALYKISLTEKREINQITMVKYWDEN